ncbi:hypothetical protein [Comamonas thiooxydans]|uniref:hypothetical protein n=1 Tax=Comamonas thiooxydans TaxID=363952 RepID=UPI0013DCE849|nr:hypothetical protein [Comamonas thiooxydans]
MSCTCEIDHEQGAQAAERPRNQLAIELKDWCTLIEADTNLRSRTSPYAVVNPATGATIEMAIGEADSEISVDGKWTPFLCFRRGKLTMNYIEGFDDPSNSQRQKSQQSQVHSVF